ncbi:Hsp70 family protein [Actinoplanes sp. LDG1-06]|uniref:Hsp70 family protein n=1 Tax=Paractinoplanes ovalisporus TaxID=2810368 RepID=A0ABS2ABD9_9ACTN|nr:Hsp70 family protein [Actinoplanes ovalisporus]MBM2616609.1 Hsp70 family protein [Actinoplanes ovalisporus]
MERTYGLGIDLGTTQTAAAVCDQGGQASVVRLGGRRAEIPSLVFVRADGGLLIGDAAERRGLAEPSRLAREFKRRIGDPVPILVGGTPFSAHALTGRLLRHVLDEVTRQREAPPSSITLTHPANWGPYKREQFEQAVRLADAENVTFRTEPEAAALHHATARRIASGETVMVYDLGGGTFDVALLRRDGDGFTLLGEPEGIEQLGGADFDEAVFAHVVGALGDAALELDADDPEVVAALARLRRDCVEAKEALSFDTEAEIPVALPGLHTRVRLNRSELESMIAPALEDTVTATRRALRSAGLDAGQVSAVLLAGGSSRIPIVGQLLGEEFGRPVIADPHPEHSIALGAALATGGLFPMPAPTSPFPVTPVAPVAPSPAEQATPPYGQQPSTPYGEQPTTPYAEQPDSGDAGQPPLNPTRVMPTQPFPAPPQRAGANGPVAFQRGAASIPGANLSSEPLAHTTAFPTDPASEPLARTAFDASPVAPHDAATPYGGGQVPPVYDNPGAPPGGGLAGAPPSSRSAGAPPYGGGAEAAYGGDAGAPPYSGSVGAPPSGGDAGTPPYSGSVGTPPGGGDAGALPYSGGAGAPPYGGNQAPPPNGGDAGRPPYGSGPGVPPGPYGVEPRTPAVWGGREPYGKGKPTDLEPPRPRRTGRRLALASGLAVVLVVGGVVGVVAYNNREKGGGQTASGPSVPPTSASPPPPYPTDAAILVRVDTGAADSANRVSKVVSFTPGTGTERTELAGTEPGDLLPRWSHRRDRIAITHANADNTNDIVIVNKDGSDRRTLVTGVANSRATWSGDDTRIAYMKKVGKYNQIFRIAVEGGEPEQITFSEADKDDPFWTIDSKAIVYWVWRAKQKLIYVINAVKLEEPGRRITEPKHGPAVDPALSPDDSFILFTRESPDGNSDIWIIDKLAKTAPRRLTTSPEREMDPTWSPDGKWFAFTRGSYDKPQIVIMKPDGTGETVLTAPGAREGHPCWF